MHIFFECSYGGPRLSLDDAVAGWFHKFLRAQKFASLGNKSTVHIRIGVSDILSTVVGHNFVHSGLVMWSSSAKFKFVAKQANTIPSPHLGSHFTSRGLWIPFSGSSLLSHYERPHYADSFHPRGWPTTGTPCASPSVGPVEYWARFHRAQRHYYHWCRPRLCSELDADFAT